MKRVQLTSRRLALTGAVGLAAIVALHGAGHADPLRNLPVCSTARLIPGQADRTPTCVPDRTHRKIAITLTARTGSTAASPELIGNYRVETDNYDGRYLAPVIEARAGDSIAFMINDQLNPVEATQPMVEYTRTNTPGAIAETSTMSTKLTNLHTHGLLVSPRNAVDIQGNGDNPFRMFSSAPCAPAMDMPGMPSCGPASGLVQIDIPATLPAGAYGNDAGAPHPSGLFWYHPHVHGIAQHQVNGGMAGLISVGDPREAIVDPANPASATLRSKVDIRYLAIKDIQLTAGRLPELATATNHPMATWRGDEFNPGYCGDISPRDTSKAVFGKGYCRPRDEAGADKSIWLFTVNGQRYPTVSIPGNRAHLWRIANLSATVSYQLHLTDAVTGNDVAMKVVSLDGVVSGRAPSSGGATSAVPVDAIETTSIRLMPASRIEVYVPNFRAHVATRRLVLKTSGVHTGPAADTWPPIELAEVRMAPVMANRPDAIMLRTTPVSSITPTVAAMTLPSGGLRAGAVNATIMPFCAHNRLAPTERRVITFAADKPKDQTGAEVEALEIGSAIVAAGSDTPVVSLPIRTMAHDMNFDRDDHGCSALGSQEVWEIVNTTDEIHNFHIHQVKFRQATAQEIATSGGGTGAAIRADLSTQESGDALFGSSADALGTWHDTFPIPAGKPGAPSRVFLHIAFVAPEQVGRFVFHCHILEHEDKGMMAPFEVLAP